MDRSALLRFYGQADLIETYWNVNPFKVFYVFSHFVDLIETYWNVNGYTKFSNHPDVKDLIETYWNVNEGYTK